MINFISPNSNSAPEETDLHETWSDAARAASAAARRKAGKGLPARQAAARAAYRKAGGTAVGSGRMKAPKTDNIHLSSHERPIDYGHVHELMMEKYGKGRGNRMYMRMIDNPSSSRGLHFVVGTKIQKEKRAMMSKLGRSGSLDSHSYRSLYYDWIKTGAK